MAGDLTFKSTVEVDEAISQLIKLKNAGIQVTDELATELNRKLGGKEIEKVVAIRTRFDDKGQLQYLKVTKDVRDQYDKLTRSLEKAEKVQRGSVTSLRQQVNQAKQARDEIVKYKAGLDGIRSRLNGITPAWVAQNEKVRQLQAELARADGSPFWERVKTGLGVGGLVSFINGLNQIVQGFQSLSIIVGQVTGSVNKLTRALADLQAFKLTFQAIGLGASGASVAFAESERIASNLGVSIKTVREGFQQLTPVITNSGGSLQDVSAIVEALSSRFAAFDIAGDRARRILNGVIQAFAKGKLQAEELTQQISEADSAFKTDFAAALGVTVAELEKLVQAGKVTVDVLIETLPKLSKASLVYGKLGKSAVDAATQLEKGATAIDLVQAKIETINQLTLEGLAKAAEPALNALIRISAVIADLSSELVQSQAGKAFIGLLAGIVKAAADLTQVLGTALRGVIAVADPFARLINLLGEIPGIAEAAGVAITAKLVASLIQLKNAFISAAVANGLFNSAIGKTISDVFGLGKAASGIAKGTGAAGAGIERLTSASERASGKVAQLKGRLQELIAQRSNLAVDDLGFAVDRQKLKSLDSQIIQTKKSLTQYSTEASLAGLSLEQLGKRSDLLTSASDRASGKVTQLKGRLQELIAQRRGLAEGAGGIAVDAQRLKLLDSQIGQTRRSLAQYSKTSADLASKSESVSAAVQATAAAAQVSQTGFAALGAKTKAVFGSLIAGTKNVAVKIAALNPKVAAVLAALLALGTAAKAYAGATSDVSDEVKKNSAALQAYKDLISEVNSTDLRPPKISAFQAAFEQLGISIAVAVDRIKRATAGVLDPFGEEVDKLVKKFDELPFFGKVLLGLANPLTSVIAGFRELTKEVDGTGLALQRFSLSGRVAIDGIDQQVDKINELTIAIRRQSQEAGSDTEKKVKVGDQYAKAKELVSATREEVQKLQDRIDAAEKTRLDGPVDPAQEEIIKELNRQLAQSKERLAVAQAGFRALGVEIGAITDEPLKALAVTLGLLGERAKELQGLLAAAPQGSKDFARLAALLKATTDEAEELQKAASDPVTLAIGVEEALIEKTKDFRDVYKKLQEETQKPLIQQDPDQIEPLKDKVKELLAEIKNLNKLKIKLEVEEFGGDSFQKINKEIQRLEEKAIKSGVDTAEFRNALIELQAVRNDLAKISAERLVFEVAFLESEGTDSLDNLQQKISKLEQARLLLPVDSPELETVNAALQLFKDDLDALNASQAIAEVDAIEGRGVKNLSNLQRQIQLLQSVLVTIPVDSPDVPRVITQLIEAEQKVSALDGARAQITIAIREEQLTSGAVPVTLGNLDRLIEGYNNRLITLPIDSPGLDEAITRLQKIQQIRELGAKSSKELRQQLTANERAEFTEQNALIKARADLEKSKAKEVADERKRQIQSASDAESRAFDRRIAQINAEVSAVQRVADARLKALSAATPAERQLQSLQEKDLRRLASSGDTREERLRARAQLERLKADRQAAEIAEQAAARKADLEREAARLAEEKAAKEEAAKKKIQEIDERIREEERTARAEEAKFREESLKIQQETYNLAREERKEQSEIIKKILNARSGDGEAKSIVESLLGTQDGLKTVLNGFAKIATDAEVAANSAADTASELEGAGSAAREASGVINDQMLVGLEKSAEQVRSISDQLRSLDGLAVRVRVVGIPGLATGGPASAGQVYQVNELGQEGFLSSSGRLAPIEKPKNALWRAPSSGTVIPAHLWAKMDVPKGGVKVGASSIPVASSDNKINNLVRQIQASMSADSQSNEIAAVQAQQAIEIGKLGRAVDKLAAKKWDVHVGVNNGSSNGYLGALNRLM